VTNGFGAWSVLLASVQSAALLEHRERAAALYPLVRQLMAYGTIVLWSHGLIEKAAGIAGNAWADAESHFENALRQVGEIPHRVEQPEVRRWLRAHATRSQPPGAAGSQAPLLVVTLTDGTRLSEDVTAVL
jgi:hypothetical protein